MSLSLFNLFPYALPVSLFAINKEVEFLRESAIDHLIVAKLQLLKCILDF